MRNRLVFPILFAAGLAACDPTYTASQPRPSVCPTNRTEVRLASCVTTCVPGVQVWSLCSAEPSPYFYTAPGMRGPYSVGYELGPASEPGACGDTAVTTRNLRAVGSPPSGLLMWPCANPEQKMNITPEMARDREYYVERRAPG